MRPDARFLYQPRHFWAHVRTISQAIGYTDKRTHQIKVPSIIEVHQVCAALGLASEQLIDPNGNITELGATLLAYFSYRAKQLNEYVEPRLMDLDRARNVFNQVLAQYTPITPIPLNKQKGEKKDYAFFTGIINTLIEVNVGSLPFDPDPRTLTTITRNNVPVRTLSRRVDGAFPGPVNPVAVWEIKEYYYTTTVTVQADLWSGCSIEA